MFAKTISAALREIRGCTALKKTCGLSETFGRAEFGHFVDEGGTDAPRW